MGVSDLVSYLSKNKEWIFSGIGVLLVASLAKGLWSLSKRWSKRGPEPTSLTSPDRLSAAKGELLTVLPIYTTPKADEEPVLDSRTFHVLKWFSTFPRGSAPVVAVAQACQMDFGDALDCVKTLWQLKFIKTVVIAPGEWKGQYAITDRGFEYVKNHAT